MSRSLAQVRLVSMNALTPRRGRPATKAPRYGYRGLSRSETSTARFRWSGSYHTLCGWDCHVCLPRGWLWSLGSSSARTTIAWARRLCVERASDVERERSLPPNVVSDVLTVYPDACAVVNCAEVQKHARARRRQPQM